MIDLSGANWRKAARSAHNGGCVEVAANLPGVTAIRDSKLPGGGALLVGRAAFEAFLADVRGGRYDPSRDCLQHQHQMQRVPAETRNDAIFITAYFAALSRSREHAD